jgi:hypothetical protein
MQYAIVIEKGATSYGAYVPDLPGCVAVGETLEEVRTLFEKRSTSIWKGYEKMEKPFLNRVLSVNTSKLHKS